MKEILHRFKSARLENERAIWIREPARTSTRPHLIVFLDAELYRDRVGAVSVIEELEARSELAPAWYVFISMESVETRWRECPCHPPFAGFINEELVPWLEASYPAIKTSDERVLVGLSYTGLAAAFVALQSPGRFGKVVAQSGSFWSNDCWLVSQFEKRASRLPTDFYLDVGRRETAENVRHREDVLQVMSQIDAVRKFRATLVAKGHEVKYVEFDGGHDFAAWRQTLPDALRWAAPLKPAISSAAAASA